MNQVTEALTDARVLSQRTIFIDFSVQVVPKVVHSDLLGLSWHMPEGLPAVLRLL